MKYLQLKNKIVKLERETLDAIIDRKPSENDLKDDWLDCYMYLQSLRNKFVLDEDRDPLYFKLRQIRKELTLIR